jgi:hypothetical protein
LLTTRWTGNYAVSSYTIEDLVGFTLAFCLAAAAGQWWTLRTRLPHANRWAAATSIGMLVAVAIALTVDVRAARVSVTVSVWDHGDPINATTRGILFGAVLGTVQALAAPFTWRHRLLWIAFSILAGGLVFVSVGPSRLALLRYLYGSTVLRDYYGIGLSLVGGGPYFSPFAWTLYALATGIVMHRLVIWGQRPLWDKVVTRFD